MANREDMIELSGDVQLMRALDSMRDASVRKIMRPAISKGVSIANKEAKRLAKNIRRTGQLWRSIGGKTKTNSRRGTVSGMVYVRRGFEKVVDGQKVDPSKYAHLVEFGTRHSAPKPFLRASLGNKRAEIQSTITKTAGDKLESEAHKASMKGKVL